jgi:hypothetical protein
MALAGGGAGLYSPPLLLLVPGVIYALVYFGFSLKRPS